MQKINSKKGRIAPFVGGLDFGKGGKGIIPMIVQDYSTREVLSLFWASRESVEKTARTGYVWRYSRRAGKVVKKGATSGNTQQAMAMVSDCDNDALLVLAKQNGSGACHTGARTCFSQGKGADSGITIDMLAGIIDRRIAKKGKGSYTYKLYKNRELALAKVEEESAEFIEAARLKPKKEIVWEACDLIYHALAAARACGVEFGELYSELARRDREKSGGKRQAPANKPAGRKKAAKK
ncbi:MAG: phosphoribosyl-ATP diphosphatase [Candidatus Micrarchaeia archaeon]